MMHTPPPVCVCVLRTPSAQNGRGRLACIWAVAAACRPLLIVRPGVPEPFIRLASFDERGDSTQYCGPALPGREPAALDGREPPRPTPAPGPPVIGLRDAYWY